MIQQSEHDQREYTRTSFDAAAAVPLSGSLASPAGRSSAHASPSQTTAGSVGIATERLGILKVLRLQSSNAAAAPPKLTVDEARDKRVFDEACPGGAWTLSVSSSEVDYIEETSDGFFEASVSVVMSLQNDGQHMHDEIGSGRVQGEASADAARSNALSRATASARKRLAKRFAGSLEPEVLGAIERAAWREVTGHDGPGASGRGRGAGRGRGRW